MFVSQYAYEPNKVFMVVFLMMIASGFGLPLPEEVYIISVGLLAYMGSHPTLFPPPFPDAPVVNGYEAAIVTFAAVVFADAMVFCIGRVFGRKLLSKDRFQVLITESLLEKINGWVKKYGSGAAFAFRFTPGIRFPAHLALGILNFSAARFLLVDGFAALISVPSQILLITKYGESILSAIHQFKFYILGGIVLTVLFIAGRKLIIHNARRKSSP